MNKSISLLLLAAGGFFSMLLLLNDKKDDTGYADELNYYLFNSSYPNPEY
jgi:hypothetical protein